MGFASGGVDVPTWSFVTRTSVRLGLTELRPPTRPNAKPRAIVKGYTNVINRVFTKVVYLLRKRYVIAQCKKRDRTEKQR